MATTERSQGFEADLAMQVEEVDPLAEAEPTRWLGTPEQIAFRDRVPHMAETIETASERGGGSGLDAIDPFPRYPYRLPLGMVGKDNMRLTDCAEAAERDPDVSGLCGAVVDVTGDPAFPPFYSLHPREMVYVASVAKIYAMYAAFELRRRVEVHTKAMIAHGLSTSTAGWKAKVFAELTKAWAPKLNAAFPRFPYRFPKLKDIFVLSTSGEVNFAKHHPPLTDADLDAPELDASGRSISPEFKTPQGEFHDWMRLMLRWSNNRAASKCILTLSYPYINGALAAAGFFDRSSKTGLWLSGDYSGHDWLPNDRAGQRLSPRWAKLQRRAVSNFAGTAWQVARLMTLLAQGRLIDAKSSTDMISILTGANGIGSYIQNGLNGAPPPRIYSSINSKIGYGDDRFSHDCAIVRVEHSGDPTKTLNYVSVVLGSPPGKGRADLHKLAVQCHDCIVTRHPPGADTELATHREVDLEDGDFEGSDGKAAPFGEWEESELWDVGAVREAFEEAEDPEQVAATAAYEALSAALEVSDLDRARPLSESDEPENGYDAAARS